MKAIIQKGTGYVVGFENDGELYVDTQLFSDPVLEAVLFEEKGENNE